MPTRLPPVRRWILILLLIVYPFQVALAMADGCCASTAGGVTHHAAEGAPSIQADDSLLAVDSLSASDEVAGAADPHCPACMFGHLLTLPSAAVDLPAGRHAGVAVATPAAFPASRPAPRPERPQWPAAAL